MVIVSTVLAAEFPFTLSTTVELPPPERVTLFARVVPEPAVALNVRDVVPERPPFTVKSENAELPTDPFRLRFPVLTTVAPA